MRNGPATKMLSGITQQQFRALKLINRNGEVVFFRGDAWNIGRNGNEERTYYSLSKRGFIDIKRGFGRPEVVLTPIGLAILNKLLSQASLISEVSTVTFCKGMRVRWKHFVGTVESGGDFEGADHRTWTQVRFDRMQFPNSTTVHDLSDRAWTWSIDAVELEEMP